MKKLGKVEREIGEMWVSSDMYNAIETMIADVSGTVEGLPNVRSYGKVSSLHVAISEDSTGTLQNLVQKYVEEEDTDKRIAIVEDILWFICDADSVDADSRGRWVDARKLKVVESFMGQSFMGINGANPIAEAAGILNKSYDEIVKMYYFSMIGSTISDVVNYKCIELFFRAYS